jgi:hypothetical protein
VVVVVVTLLELVDVVVVVVVVVVVGQPGPQASQQLGFVPTVAGALHKAALRLVLQWTLPLALVRQQVTKPGLPQVDREAQRMTACLQLRGSVGLVFAACATHRTY